MFYPTENDVTIKQGDYVAAVCTMYNSQSRVVRIGYNHFFLYIINLFEYFSSTGDDEMCNFYMMYWVDGDQLLEDNVCASPGPPNYYFAEDQVNLIFILIYSFNEFFRI